jgi:hypothetical protein
MCILAMPTTSWRWVRCPASQRRSCSAWAGGDDLLEFGREGALSRLSAIRSGVIVYAGDGRDTVGFHDADIRLTGVHTPLFEHMLAHDKKYYARASNSSHEERPARPIEPFDHRVIQSHYYQIADYWIFTCEWLPLFAQDQECVERFQADWVKFLFEEAASLAAIDHVWIDILTAVTFQNEDAGCAAEKRLADTQART